MLVLLVLGGAFAAACAVLIFLWQKYRRLAERLKPISDLDREAERLRSEIAAAKARADAQHKEADARLASSLAERDRAATLHLQQELDRLTGAVTTARDERTRLEADIVGRREAADREHAAVLAAQATHARDAESASKARLAQLEADYESGHATYQRLKHELSLLNDLAEDVSVGLYKPTYAFDAPAQYKAALDRVWQEQKTLVKMDDATTCPHEWSVGGSRAEGRRMQKQLAKLMLRAFNGEVEAAVARVSWNNVTRMEERIRKSYEAVNGLGTVIGVSITQRYADLALAELRLTYEHEQKKQDIAEEQRALRERMREEEKAQREAQRAEDEAARDEARYEKALAKARADIERAKGVEVDALRAKIAMLEQSAAEAHAQKERAKSMAELTRSGYVYVISNIGSFGENVYKIGMTRRLDPMDRIRELGDASVPFEFDVHAMVYTDDAPTLECEFHRRFADQRVNLLNTRKEFFATSIADISAFVQERGLNMELTLLAEAREFRESIAVRTERLRATSGRPPAAVAPDPFPARVVPAAAAAAAM